MESLAGPKKEPTTLLPSVPAGEQGGVKVALAVEVAVKVSVKVAVKVAVEVAVEVWAPAIALRSQNNPPATQSVVCFRIKCRNSIFKFGNIP